MLYISISGICKKAFSLDVWHAWIGCSNIFTSILTTYLNASSKLVFMIWCERGGDRLGLIALVFLPLSLALHIEAKVGYVAVLEDVFFAL